MGSTRAVLFDFGGTLYDYGCFAAAESESLLDLARAVGVTADAATIAAKYREAMRRVFRSYLPRSYYLHRDLFRDAVTGMLESLGVTASPAQLEAYRRAQWQRHARDFQLRPGVTETLAELQARGLHVGMVSNIDEDQLDHLLEVAGLRPYFDAILSSERAESCKPHGVIFERALADAGVTAEAALFVGDTLQQDIAGAQRLGMSTALIWHRPDRPPPDDGPRPDHIITAIPEILAIL